MYPALESFHVQVDAGVEITDHEATNAASEAGKQNEMPGASVGVKQGPEEGRHPSPPQQQGAFKRLLSRLPFFGQKQEDGGPTPTPASNAGASVRLKCNCPLSSEAVDLSCTVCRRRPAPEMVSNGWTQEQSC